MVAVKANSVKLPFDSQLNFNSMNDSLSIVEKKTNQRIEDIKTRRKIQTKELGQIDYGLE